MFQRGCPAGAPGPPRATRRGRLRRHCAPGENARRRAFEHPRKGPENNSMLPRFFPRSVTGTCEF
ncbi:hypothetical protein CSC28_4982 [Pseudomonas paraeruginosa]|nr:hypothetical protein CSC28_4982 [Pseudomonas paraeruginosa]